MGHANNNTVSLQAGKVTGDVAGGLAGTSGWAAAKNNTVTITGGEVGGTVGGGKATSGEATDNTVTITGGQVNGHVYGGYSATGTTIRNTVNLGDGVNAMTAGYHLDEIYGGNQADVAGNTLNVKTNVEAKNIKNFEKITFHYNTSFAAGTPLLKLTDGAGTTIKNLSNIEIKEFLGKCTVMENAYGITITDGEAPLSNTTGNQAP